MTPNVLVCAGGGGVGKTTCSTALAMTLARAGKRTLIVTIDPARRLADALGVELGPSAQRIGGIDGNGALFALMPEAERGMRAFAMILFEDEPEARARILQNRIYQALEDTVPGIQELVCMHLVSRAIKEHDIDYLVVDTAPSRFALDFVTYPSRLARLLEGRAMTFLAKMSGRGDKKPGRVEKLLGQVMGPSIGSAADLFADLGTVRQKFVTLNQRASELLIGPRTRYLIVLAPTGGALDDACYLHDQLRSINIRPAGAIINRAARDTLPWFGILSNASETPSDVREVLRTLEGEEESRMLAADVVASELRRRFPMLPQIRLPFFEATQPDALVRMLSEWMFPQLPDLLGVLR